MQTSLHFGLTQRPEVLVDFHRYLLFGYRSAIGENEVVIVMIEQEILDLHKPSYNFTSL